MAHWCPLVAILLTTLLAAVIIPLQANTESVASLTSSCFRKETYNTTSKVKVQIPVNKTRYDWCLGGFMRCMVYKVEMAEREINVTEIRSRIVEMCCPGTVPAPGSPAQSTNESLHCIPANEATTTTTKATTIPTTTPREVCKAGLWGRGCSHTCPCGPGVPCDQDNGTCRQTVVNVTCSPTDRSCASTTQPQPTEAATQPSATSTTTVPTSSTFPSHSPSPTTTTYPSYTSPQTSTAPTTPSTQITPKPTTTTEKAISPSTAPEIPSVATTESPRTVSTPSPITKLTDLTTVRPIVLATRGWDPEHVTIERRKDTKSMAQPAKTTAQHIDPESVNRVDTSAGNGKHKPDAAPINNSFVITLPTPTTTTTTTPKPASTRLPTSTVTPATNPSPFPVTPVFNLRNLTAMVSTSPKSQTMSTIVSTFPNSQMISTSPKPQTTSTATSTVILMYAKPHVTSSNLQTISTSPNPISVDQTSSRKPTSLPLSSSSAAPTSVAQGINTTLATPTAYTPSKKSEGAADDNSSADSESDEDSDDEEDTEDDEEDSDEDKNFNNMREETIVSPLGKPATRIDHMETKINGSSKKMLWTFQTDFSVGPPIKLASPSPRKNAISPEGNRNSSIPYSDKVNEDKATGPTTVTYGMKPWMPVLNLASGSSHPENKMSVQSTLDKEIFQEFSETPTWHTSTQRSTYSTQSTAPESSAHSVPTTTAETPSTRIVSTAVTSWAASQNITKTSLATMSTSTTFQATNETDINTHTSTLKSQDSISGHSSLSTLLAGTYTKVQTISSAPSTAATSTQKIDAEVAPTESSTQATSATSISTSTARPTLASTSTLTPLPQSIPTLKPVLVSSTPSTTSNPVLAFTSFHDEVSSTQSPSPTIRSTVINIPLETIPNVTYSIPLKTASPFPIPTTTSTLGLRENTTLQGHVRTTADPLDITSRKGG